MDIEVKKCGFCNREAQLLYKHHVVPKVKGGLHGETIDCCETCSKQVHMLFTESELKTMTLEQLNNKPEWKSYLKWISTRNREFSVKMSSRVKHKRSRRKK
jgi:hypothetical protein